MSEWISVESRLPELVDGGVLVYFSRSDAVETVNIEDYFRPITAGLDEAGNQKYALWATYQGVTHWMPLPAPPKPQAHNNELSRPATAGHELQRDREAGSA